MDKELNKKLFETAIFEIEREKNSDTIEKIKEQIKNEEFLAAKTKEAEENLNKLRDELRKQNEILEQLKGGDVSNLNNPVKFNLEKKTEISFLRELWDRVIIVINPMFWTMSEKFSKKLDDQLNNLMKENKFVKNTYSDCHAQLGNERFWIENYPYSCFESDTYENLRPSRLTILRAKRKLDKDLNE